jgi:hypothetical protein
MTWLLLFGAACSCGVAAYEAAHRRWYYAAVQVAPWLPLAVALAIGD